MTGPATECVSIHQGVDGVMGGGDRNRTDSPEGAEAWEEAGARKRGQA